MNYIDCACGCMEPVLQTNKYRPNRFILGHQNRLKDWGSVEERFWSKVDRRGEDECWPWTGANCGGVERRGVFWYEGRREKAPKIALILSGIVAKDEFDWALHSCDNANCVNPKHLRFGTRKDNHEDKITRGRNSNSTPTLREKRAVLHLHGQGVRLDVIAEAFGFSIQVVEGLVK